MSRSRYLIGIDLGTTNCAVAYVDTHGAPVVEPVFDLLTHVLERVDVKAILLERDQNFPADFDDLLSELDDIRAVVKKSQPEMLKKNETKQFVSAGSNTQSARQH